MVLDENMLIKKEDMVTKKGGVKIKEDVKVEDKRDRLYLMKIGPLKERLISLIKESSNGEVELKIKDIKNMMGDEFKDRNVTSFYSMIKLILIESGIKVQLHHHYGANLVMTFASESEIRPSIEITRERMRKTAKNAGYENYADYLINTPYHGSRWNITNKEDNRFFVVIGKKYIANELFPGATIDDHSYINRYTEHSGYDWMTSDGIKVKHFGSRIRCSVDEEGFERNYFQWGIGKNNRADIFILTGWGNGDGLELELIKGWIVDKKEVVNGREFWDRVSFLISTHKRSIDKYSKFEIDNDKLEVIRKTIRDTKQNSITYYDFVDYRIEIAEWYSTIFRTVNW